MALIVQKFGGSSVADAERDFPRGRADHKDLCRGQ